MRVVTFGIMYIGFADFVLTVYTFFHPETVLKLLSLMTLALLVVALFLSAYHGFRVWRRSSKLWVLPSLMCFTFLVTTWYTAVPIGQSVADWEFKRHLNEYLKVVEDFKSGRIPCLHGCNGEFDRLDTGDGLKHVKFLLAARCEGGTVGVAFIADTDVILLHEGYFFKSYGDGSACSADPFSLEKKWPYVRHVEGQWYHFSDEPGL
ncbi:MAG: hypothetical protein P4N59_29805 [Negativicutes bacterium]|nr:hypothetical protein [Negativicutes bacterium]